MDCLKEYGHQALSLTHRPVALHSSAVGERRETARVRGFQHGLVAIPGPALCGGGERYHRAVRRQDETAMRKVRWLWNRGLRDRKPT
jgi:hypothetical protein